MYSSQIHAAVGRDPEAMCFRLFSLTAILGPESPTTPRRAGRASESRSPPACCRQRGWHSEGMSSNKTIRSGQSRRDRPGASATSPARKVEPSRSPAWEYTSGRPPSRGRSPRWPPLYFFSSHPVPEVRMPPRGAPRRSLTICQLQRSSTMRALPLPWEGCEVSRPHRRRSPST